MRFYGQWDPPVDQVLYEKFFKDKKNGVFIEAGASDGLTECSCKFFEEFMGWTGYNIEPDPFLFNLCQKNRPNSININAALSDKIGETTFTKAIHPSHGELFGNGSLSHTKSHFNELKREGCTFNTFNVKTTTFKQLISDYNIQSIDLMVLDVEGHEIAVLTGMADCHILPTVLCIEFGHNTAELGKIVEQFGYKFQFNHANNSYYKL